MRTGNKINVFYDTKFGEFEGVFEYHSEDAQLELLSVKFNGVVVTESVSDLGLDLLADLAFDEVYG